MSKVARLTGLCSWSLDIEDPVIEPDRDTTGPGGDGFLVMLNLAREASAQGV